MLFWINPTSICTETLESQTWQRQSYLYSLTFHLKFKFIFLFKTPVMGIFWRAFITSTLKSFSKVFFWENFGIIFFIISDEFCEILKWFVDGILKNQFHKNFLGASFVEIHVGLNSCFAKLFTKLIQAWFSEKCL